MSQTGPEVGQHALIKARLRREGLLGAAWALVGEPMIVDVRMIAVKTHVRLHA
jgi:hypothetical protein